MGSNKIQLHQAYAQWSLADNVLWSFIDVKLGAAYGNDETKLRRHLLLVACPLDTMTIQALSD